MLHDEYIAQPCPQCGEMVYIRIKDFNCRIFRHGVYKSTRKQIDSHSTKEQCDELVKNDLIWGCGKPFKLVNNKDKNSYEKYKLIVCDYI
jgi:hypothetical protein